MLINLTKESVKMSMIAIEAGGEADTELPPEESSVKMTSEMKTCSRKRNRVVLGVTGSRGQGGVTVNGGCARQT